MTAYMCNLDDIKAASVILHDAGITPVSATIARDMATIHVLHEDWDMARELLGADIAVETTATSGRIHVKASTAHGTDIVTIRY